MSSQNGQYYLPEPSHWPIVGSIGLLVLLTGAANWLHGESFGPYMFATGFAIIIILMFGWFGTVIKENRMGLNHTKQVDVSFRWGMCWFIFSEVMFFGAFFGALFYVREFAVDWLSGATAHGVMTHLLLWPNFTDAWPVFQNPNPEAFVGPRSIMETWGIPAINTLILLTSGVTVTVAHWALLKEKRTTMLVAQLLTVLLGIAFLSMQCHEYLIAYLDKGLKISTGIYGTTFFMLTGFHAMHVTIGTIMLIVILYRMLRRDFSPDNHFAFEAASWYWHFVDVVWLGLFIFVYWL
jgi:cytochrome c oxidase subunit 3